MLLGAIADDVTGATDLASVIMRAGRSVVLTMGVPVGAPPAVDAVVVATKARTAPLDEARAMIEAAAAFLERAGADQFYFKYCSTFDSTEEGNIGPIADLLLDRFGEEFTVCAPSYPALRRTVYEGHLFVGDQLLSDSPMRNHPLTPMHDANLVRFLGKQTAGMVGLAPFADVEAGEVAVRDRFGRLRADGVRMVIADAITDGHIGTLAKACSDLKLVTGGAALGGALAGLRPANRAASAAASRAGGPTALLSGSCSAMTQAQVAEVSGHVPSYVLDPLQLASEAAAIERAVDWAVEHARRGDFLVYSTADASAVRGAQSQLGREQAAHTLERAFARIADRLAAAGVRRFVVAGGETSGAVTQALDVRMMTFGEELAPGVPWTYTLEPQGFTLALKSGNFGGPDFFRRALL